jgi:hypothetical protein
MRDETAAFPTGVSLLKADSIEYGLHMERLRGGETFKRWLKPCLSTFR